MRRAALAAAGATALAALAATPAAYGVSSAPRPTRIPLLAPIRDVDPLQSAASLGFRKDRLLKSVVPGPVRTTEQVTVAVGPAGVPVRVVDLQQLVITRAGNYIIRELGPARKADGLDDTVPPVL